jgi:2-iminobutanoate/2-iminopropanoate deaminase
MTRIAIRPPELPAANSTYSPAIQAGGLVFVSGQVGVNPETGRLVSDDIAEQAKQAMENLVAILRAAGSSLDKVVSTNLYLTEYGDLARVNQVWLVFSGEWSGQNIVRRDGAIRRCKIRDSGHRPRLADMLEVRAHRSLTCAVQYIHRVTEPRP